MTHYRFWYLCNLVFFICLAATANGESADVNIFRVADRLVNWEELQVPPKEEWSGYYINLTAYPGPHTQELIESGRLGKIGEDQVLFLPFLVGFGWKSAVDLAIGAYGLYATIDGCVYNDGSTKSIVNCALGVACTAWSIGAAYRAFGNARGWFGKAANVWSNSGLENIALDVFNKRAQETQQSYDTMMRDVLREFDSSNDPLFLGYAHSNHLFARRDAGDLHPMAPIFRIHNVDFGFMDVGLSDHLNGTHLTVQYSNHLHNSSHSTLQKREEFRHQRFSEHALVARFDAAAARADPQGQASFNAAGGYAQILSEAQCFFSQTGNAWRPEAIIEAQFYDTMRQGTFDFAALGIFNTGRLHGKFAAYTPRGLPIKVHNC